METFASIQQQLAPPSFPDAGVIEAISQLVERTNKRARGVLPPFNRLEYNPTPFSETTAIGPAGLRAYVSMAISALGVAIEGERLLSKEHLLLELEDLIRSMPPRATIRQETEQNLSWLGRLSAAIESWNPAKSDLVNGFLNEFTHPNAHEAGRALKGLVTLLHQARFQIRMETVGPTSVVVGHKMVFDYFDELRKLIEPARQDLFFVDPYLDAEFVSRYLPHVAQGVPIRLLTRERLAKLLPAVDAFARQSGIRVEVRSGPGFHDRYVFVDKMCCYQSGASFKDGAKSAPTALTQIMDAFEVVLKTYEDLWLHAKIER